MGHNGISPAFGSADAGASGDAMSEYARRADVLGTFVDDAVESEHRVAIAMARRSEAIERARAYSEQLAADTLAGGSGGRSIDLARRAFVSEIAAALRIP